MSLVNPIPLSSPHEQCRDCELASCNHRHICQTHPEPTRRYLCRSSREAQDLGSNSTCRDVYVVFALVPEHAGEPRVPKGTEMPPLAIFSLYWGNEVVIAANLFAESKQNGIPPERRDLQ